MREVDLLGALVGDEVLVDLHGILDELLVDDGLARVVLELERVNLHVEAEER